MQILFQNAVIPPISQTQTKYYDAVLIEDGTIQALGSAKTLRPLCHADCTVQDCEGNVLLPAFLDAHSHITGCANSLNTISLRNCKSFSEIKEKIIRDLHTVADTTFLIGSGYDQNRLLEKKHPDKTVLDQACPNKPLIITHISGHMGVCNTAALQYFNITQSTPDPDNGKIARDASGNPTGYLEEDAYFSMKRKLPPLDNALRLQNLIKAQDYYLQYGIPLIQDGLTRESQWNQLQLFAQSGNLKTDIVCYIDLKNASQLLQENASIIQTPNGSLRIGGCKILLDGSPQGRTAWMSEPYYDVSDSYCGYPLYSDAQVREFVRIACEHHMQLLCHCNGDAAAEQFISACEWAQKCGYPISTLRPVMIHAQFLRRDQLPRMAHIGMIASFFVAHTYYWGDTHLAYFGKERAAYMSPAASALRNHVHFTFHQDSPILPPNMLETIQCAVRRTTRADIPLASSECLSVQDALKAVTSETAYQYFMENKRGQIAPNYAADFVLLDQDPLTVTPNDFEKIRILKTIRSGQTVWHA